jgi:adenine-specific DNA-methyltransferase
MSQKQRLELTWIGKDTRPRLEPRILIEDPDKSYHASRRLTENDIFDNRLIFGDNLLALKALEAEFTGQVKCVYIDPPFNTQQAFEHYDDGIEHSIWLSMMRDRIDIIAKLLAPAGSIFVHIDDNELGYLIALMDEVFGRHNRIAIITFKQSSASGPKSINPGLVTTNNYILYYAKDKAAWSPNRVFVPTCRDDRYSKFIENYDRSYENWNLVQLKDAFLRAHRLVSWNDAKLRFLERLEDKLSDFVLENADRVVRTARVAPKDVNESARRALLDSTNTFGKVFKSERLDKEDYYFLNGEQLIFYKTKTKVIDGKLSTASPLTNLWDDLLSNNLHNEGGISFPNGKKPESLIKRCLELATNPGDLVLDSFAGSGTTGAVAHKMGRRWIMVELGEHCHTHIIPRLGKIIDGEDPGGITKVVNWRGGGGFRYYRLAPSLLEKDRWGNWIISRQYNAAMLSEAVCKLMGYTYSPSERHYWQHGTSSERDFIYVTTQSLTHDQLRAIAEEVGEERSLLVCCKAFHSSNLNAFPNLTVNKIPNAVLRKCEWGKDDYSLNVANLPMAQPHEESPPLKQKNRGPIHPDLFGEGEG